MKSINLILVLVFLVLSSISTAQEIISVQGEGQVRMENNQTKEQAYEKAEEQAIINAIDNSFGTYVEQNTDVVVNDGSINYNIIGTTLVKGEWIRTKQKRFSEEIEQTGSGSARENIIWVKCTIKGEARKIISKAKLESLALKCTDINCASEKFEDGQSLYVYFKSPVNGYLSVFIDEGDITRRLFPYISQGNESGVKVEGDKDYILFTNQKRLNAFDAVVDKIELSTVKTIEFNTLYVVFSQEPYIKPILSNPIEDENGYFLPKSLSSAVFQEWMADCRAASDRFQSVKIKISISKK
ncbi:MAG: hypothetical protein AB9834_19300 [Lentimicrobium sp.]